VNGLRERLVRLAGRLDPGKPEEVADQIIHALPLAMGAEGGVLLVTRNAAGALVIEGRRPDGSAQGFATYMEGSRDFHRALDDMVGSCLPAHPVVCKRCGEPAGGRTMVAVHSGGAMHRNPCWSTALDEAVQDA
jgi:hypothetical protein